MAVVHLLCSFLLARGNERVEDALWHIVLKVNVIKDYSWAEALYKFLVASMNEAELKVQSREVSYRSTARFLNSGVVVLHVKLTY